MTAAHTIRLGTRGQPEESRAAILKAAVREFAREGVAGARTDAIARLARVNKALIYYYFKDKEALYDAVLDEVFSGVRAAIITRSRKSCRRARSWKHISAHTSTTLLRIRHTIVWSMRNFCVPDAIRPGCNAWHNTIFVRSFLSSPRCLKRAKLRAISGRLIHCNSFPR